jgi:phosphoribosylamine--glycine ligase
MAEEGMPFVGVLYAGLMLTSQGPMVLEFNARFGDPETQALLPLLETDLIDVLLACVEGRLEQAPVQWKNEAAVTVVMAAQGYPDQYPTGHDITGIERATDAGCIVYLAGARRKEKRVLTAGGRVLSVTALGSTIEQAAQRAYRGVEKIAFNGAQYRLDIGRERPPQARGGKTKPRPSGAKKPSATPRHKRKPSVK